MKQLTLFIMLFWAFAAHAQTETRYFTKNGKQVSPDSADHYITAAFNDAGRINGAYTIFYANGQKKEEGVKGPKGAEGKIYYWYANGQAQSVELQAEELAPGEYRPHRVEQYWGYNGKQMVTDGNGLCQIFDTLGVLQEQGQYVNTYKQGKWEGFNQDTLIYEELYEAGEFKGGKRLVNGQFVPYYTFEEYAAPVGGMHILLQHIQRTLEYPKEAARNGIQGKVFVEFIVDLDGSITDVKTLRGIGGGCDEEAVRVIATSPRWQPAKQRGRPVRQKMSMPVSFKLLDNGKPKKK